MTNCQWTEERYGTSPEEGGTEREMVWEGLERERGRMVRMGVEARKFGGAVSKRYRLEDISIIYDKY